ncbi:hypothetical protein [Streptomyces sp. 2224.1]|uniref:hypothetical protein n=1 Tax=Streptomyces sp. 2224.1 TaxID=1881020 RepID=UPI001160A647|nr:hypothetical protein [Streptomyces sp. 2224.1]
MTADGQIATGVAVRAVRVVQVVRVDREGKWRTQQVIDNDPVLPFVLRLRDQSDPRGLPVLTAHIPSLASEANAQGTDRG